MSKPDEMTNFLQVIGEEISYRDGLPLRKAIEESAADWLSSAAREGELFVDDQPIVMDEEGRFSYGGKLWFVNISASVNPA